MSFLIDTNIISELVRPRPDQHVLAWAGTVFEKHLSAITIEELRFGLTSRPKAAVDRWIEAFIADACRVLPVTDAIARHAGVLRGEFRRRGSTRTQADMLIASTAVLHGLTLVTRNTSDFEGCGVTVLDPFQ